MPFSLLHSNRSVSRDLRAGDGRHNRAIKTQVSSSVATLLLQLWMFGKMLQI